MQRAAGEASSDAPSTDETIYDGLRQQLLSLDPATVGLLAAPEDSGVWGVLFELGRPGGSASLVALKDGTTSLYATGGFGILGGEAHPQIVTATRNLISAVARKLDLFTPDTVLALPAPDRVAVRALTHSGVRTAEAADEDLVDGTHLLSDIFFAGHGVIALLRSVDADQPTQPE